MIAIRSRITEESVINSAVFMRLGGVGRFGRFRIVALAGRVASVRPNRTKTR